MHTSCWLPSLRLQGEGAGQEARRRPPRQPGEHEALEGVPRARPADPREDLLGRAVDDADHRHRVEQLLGGDEQLLQRAEGEQEPGEEDDGHGRGEADAGHRPPQHGLGQRPGEPVHEAEEPHEGVDGEDDRHHDHEAAEKEVAQVPREGGSSRGHEAAATLAPAARTVYHVGEALTSTTTHVRQPGDFAISPTAGVCHPDEIPTGIRDLERSAGAADSSSPGEPKLGLVMTGDSVTSRSSSATACEPSSSEDWLSPLRHVLPAGERADLDLPVDRLSRRADGP